MNAKEARQLRDAAYKRIDLNSIKRNDVLKDIFKQIECDSKKGFFNATIRFYCHPNDLSTIIELLKEAQYKIIDSSKKSKEEHWIWLSW